MINVRKTGKKADRTTALQFRGGGTQKQEVRYKLKQTTANKEQHKAHRIQSVESGP